MKVLQINAVYGHASTGEIAREINLCVKQNGGKIYAASSEAAVDAPELDGYFAIGNRFDHKIHGLYSRLSGCQGYASTGATKKLIHQIDEIQPDIIHLHNLHSNYINLKILFAYIMQKKIKTVITLHDCWFLTGKCSHFMYTGCQRWRNHCGECPWLKEEIPSWLFDKTEQVLRDKAHFIGENENVYVVGCSDWITNIARESILKNRVWGTIHNGIDVSIFCPRQSNLRNQHGIENCYVILGMANKWLSKENKEVFQGFTAKLKSDERLMLIGCTQEQIKVLPDKVVGVGYVRGRKELAEYYSMADVFMNVTKVDSFPTVNMEALACGTPVITFDSGGSTEIITEKNGVAVPYGDVTALVNQKAYFRKIGKKMLTVHCTDYVRKHFEKEKCYLRYIDLYNTLMHEYGDLG